jgi:hypothetical protein
MHKLCATWKEGQTVSIGTRASRGQLLVAAPPQGSHGRGLPAYPALWQRSPLHHGFGWTVDVWKKRNWGDIMLAVL